MAVKIGFVGSGGVAGTHMSALDKIEDAQIVACMDVDEDRAAQAAACHPGVASYSDLVKMLAEQELDTAYVCVPPHAHGEVELALIEHGIPFFLETPIGIDRKAPNRVLESLKGKNLLTSVGYMSRYRTTVERAKQNLGGDPPVIARGGCLGGLPALFWWCRKGMSGGQIVEETTHIIDLARYLFGEVTSVFCAGRTGLITGVEDYDVEGATACTLIFESGMICEISSSCAVGVGGSVSLEIFCRNSRLKLFGADLQLEVEKASEFSRIRSVESIFEVEDRVWIEAVLSGDGSRIKSPYEDAYRTQMVACAANESMASGKPQKP